MPKLIVTRQPWFQFEPMSKPLTVPSVRPIPIQLCGIWGEGGTSGPVPPDGTSRLELLWPTGFPLGAVGGCSRSAATEAGASVAVAVVAARLASRWVWVGWGGGLRPLRRCVASLGPGSPAARSSGSPNPSSSSVSGSMTVARAADQLVTRQRVVLPKICHDVGRCLVSPFCNTCHIQSPVDQPVRACCHDVYV